MRQFVFVLCCLLSWAVQTYAIMCYSCQDVSPVIMNCTTMEAQYPVDCGPGWDACTTIVTRTYDAVQTIRVCGHPGYCEAIMNIHLPHEVFLSCCDCVEDACNGEYSN